MTSAGDQGFSINQFFRPFFSTHRKTACPLSVSLSLSNMSVFIYQTSRPSHQHDGYVSMESLAWIPYAPLALAGDLWTRLSRIQTVSLLNHTNVYAIRTHRTHEPFFTESRYNLACECFSHYQRESHATEGQEPQEQHGACLSHSTTERSTRQGHQQSPI